ncbi:hypothetical protein JCM5350_004204 [Sporobolomyces pararoseus]
MSNLVPRVYQEEAAREALRGNRIIRADTGTGKTLVAILLLKQITSTSNKFAVFISPNVTLVFQQAVAIEEATNLRVKTFVGADGVDYWKREQWVEKITSCDVGVMTPQVFLNLCDNAYWTFDRISLVIFDECHNCSKNHPGATVMRNHYHPLKLRNPSLLPRILGLTASPIYNVKRPEKTIADLEAVLDSRILEVTSAASVSRKAQELLVEHSVLGPEPPLTSSDRSLLDILNETGKLDYRATMRATACDHLFGRFGLDLYLSLLAEECEASTELITELRSRTTNLDESKLSPKLAILIQCLESYKGEPHFHAIVFVQQRHHAKILSHILSLVPSLSWIKPGFLTGHGGRVTNEEGEVSKDLGMEIKEQQETVKKFRNEELNLIVATSVAEEGLDFQACNVVVRFDSLQTITGYIQSRGRARAANARFVVIAEEGSEDAARYKKYVSQEEELKTLYADRPEKDLEEPELDNLPTYSTSTGALLTFKNSIPLLSTFCSLLKRTDQFTPAQKPVYRCLEDKAKFCYELTLPKIAALSQTTFVSDVFPTKKAARQQTAYNCCIELHKAGALDDYLLPVRETLADGAKDANGREVDRTLVPKQIPVSTPNPLGNVWAATSAFLHVVDIVNEKGVRQLGLLCATRQSSLEDGGVFDPDGNQAKVRISRVEEVRWTTQEERDEQLRQLESFNRFCVRIQLDRHLSDDDKFFALWVPLTSDGTVDSTLINEPSRPFDSSAVTSHSLIVVPLRRPHHRIGRFVRVRNDVNSSSSTSEIIPNPPRKKIAVVARFSDYAKYLSIMYEYNNLKRDVPEAIVEFDSLSFSPYFLGPAPKLPQQVDELRVFPTSMCQISNLPLTFWEMFSMTPALSRLISTRTMSRLAMERLELPSLEIDQFARALTTPSSLAGIDYEYLETLGDSFLKLATSIHVYLGFPTAEEGRLTILRMNSVDNRFLRQQCVKTGLDKHIQASPLRSAEPSDSMEIATRGDSFTRLVNRKVLSDVVEATLGAAVLSGGTPIALGTGEKLGLCFGGTSQWNERPSAKKLTSIEPFQLPRALEFLEEGLGYKIKSQGQLLVQALTHRSFPGAGYCYEREEYLGDAVLDWWATVRLFPIAASTTPRLLTFRRAMLVSNPTLALLAIRKLRIHKSILHNSPLLETAIREAVEYAEKTDWKDVVAGDLIWVWSPPKVLGDVFEAILAVIFIDSGFDLDTVFAVLDKIYEDIMPFVATETERRDPHSRLLMWKDVHACRQINITLVRSEPTTPPTPASYTSTITFHSTQIAHQSVTTKSVARQLAASEALVVLEGEGGRVCDCKERKMKEKLESKAAEEKLVEEIAMEIECEEVESEMEAIDRQVDMEDEAVDEKDVEMMSEEEREATLPLRVREY